MNTDNWPNVSEALSKVDEMDVEALADAISKLIESVGEPWQHKMLAEVLQYLFFKDTDVFVEEGSLYANAFQAVYLAGIGAGLGQAEEDATTSERT